MLDATKLHGKKKIFLPFFLTAKYSW